MNQKTITLNPEFLKIQNTKPSKQTRKKSDKKSEKPQKLRKELLSRIKEHQKKQEMNSKSDISIDIEPDNFTQSLNYLSNLSKNKKSSKIKKSSPKNLSTPQSLVTNSTSIGSSSLAPRDSPLVMSPSISSSSNNIKIQGKTAPSNLHLNQASSNKKNEISVSPQSTSAGVKRGEEPIISQSVVEPQYSNLKGGVKPSYREWKRSTQKNYIEEDNLPILTGNIEGNSKDKNNESISLDDEILKKNKKLKLGKSKETKKISVLIKSRDTRKNIQGLHGDLKKKNLMDIKKYLKQKNLLKIGAEAPVDVLRQTYEQSILSGDIFNKSNETLSHNFYSEIN